MKAAQDIILTPVITERSVDDMAESKYTFKVAKDANKVEIAKAAEELFQVQVLKVNTVNCTGHTKRGQKRRQASGLQEGCHHHQSGADSDKDGKKRKGTIEFFDGMF